MYDNNVLLTVRPYIFYVTYCRLIICSKSLQQKNSSRLNRAENLSFSSVLPEYQRLKFGCTRQDNFQPCLNPASILHDLYFFIFRIILINMFLKNYIVFFLYITPFGTSSNTSILHIPPVNLRRHRRCYTDAFCRKITLPVTGLTDFPMNEISVISVQARISTESLLAYPDGRAFAVIVVHERIRKRT